MSGPGGGGFGVVGLGDSGAPTPHRTRPDLCASHKHPLVTFNPWANRTWCLCGKRNVKGNKVSVPHLACCGGPLTEPRCVCGGWPSECGCEVAA